MQAGAGEAQGRCRGGAGEVQGRGGHLLQLSPLSPQQRHLAARVPTLRGHRIQARCCARNHSPVRIGSGLDRAGQAGQAAVGLRLLLGTQEHADEVVRRVRQCGHARRGPPEEVRALGVCHGPRALPVGVCTSRTSRVAPRSKLCSCARGRVIPGLPDTPLYGSSSAFVDIPINYQPIACPSPVHSLQSLHRSIQ